MCRRGWSGARNQKPSPMGSVSVGHGWGGGQRWWGVVQCGRCMSEGGWGGWRPVPARGGRLAHETANRALWARFRCDLDGAVEYHTRDLWGAGERRVEGMGGLQPTIHKEGGAVIIFQLVNNSLKKSLQRAHLLLTFSFTYYPPLHTLLPTIPSPLLHNIQAACMLQWVLQGTGRLVWPHLTYM